MEKEKRRNELVDILTSWDNWNSNVVDENLIDMLFQCAQELDEIEDKLSDSALQKPVDVLLENIIKSQNFNDEITLYAIDKYITLYQESGFSEFLDKFVSEINLRGNIFKLVEELPDVDLDLLSLNNFISNIYPELKSKIFQVLKSQCSTFLKAIKYSDFIISKALLKEMIVCLESQPDLRLWFTVMKKENLNLVLDLCARNSNFFNAVLKFFDKFANEVESTYDEDLNIQYSHVNLDFEKFVEIIQLFLEKSTTKNIISEYLSSKNLDDKNFCFWVDVKACI